MNREVMPERVFCTIITKNYLAYARTLAMSIAEHHPIGKLYVLLADRIDGYFEPQTEPFELIQLQDLPEQDTIGRMCFYYNPFELCCALRGALHEYMLNSTAAESWIFLDADIMVFDCLDPIFEQLSKTSILLTPHCQTPVYWQDSNPHEFNFLRNGLFNAGFLGLCRTQETREFIQWFKERLTHYCFSDQSLGNLKGLFVDQLWLNLAVLYFKADFLIDPGANLGHWNLWERQIELSGETIKVNDKPLLFVHFSGWDIEQPNRVSKHSLLYHNYANAAWSTIALSYQDKLLKHGYTETTQYPYAFDRFETGELITLTMRRAYYNDLERGVEASESPFKRADYFQSHSYKLINTFELEEELAIVNIRLAEWDVRLNRTQAEMLAAQTQLIAAQTELTTTQATLATTQAELTSTQTGLIHTQTVLASTQAELDRLRQFAIEVEASKFWKLKKRWSGFKDAVKHALKK